MKYTNKQIKRILRIKEFVDMSNTLSLTYKDFDNKEFIVETFTNRDRIYKLYCSSLYNLVDAIQKSKDFFEKANKYDEFKSMLEQEFFAYDNEYCDKGNYKSTLFKIIETIRHQTNHFTCDDDDDNILFETYIDFEMLEKLRTLINDIFFEIYNEINNDKIKQIILAKPKIRYSIDQITNKVDELKIPDSENRLNRIFRKENERVIELFEQLFNGSNLYDLFMRKPEAIEKFILADKEIKESFKKTEKYINAQGTELEKESLRVFKEYIEETRGGNINDSNKRVEELKSKLEKLKESMITI